MGDIFIYGAGDQIVYSHFTTFVGPFPNRNVSNFVITRSQLLFCRTSSSHLTRPGKI